MRRERDNEAKAATSAAATGTERSLIEDLVNATPLAQLGGAALVGECRDDRHPSMADRYLVRYPGPGGEAQERWLMGLVSVIPKIGDRLLLVQPGNAAEPVILGVLGGLTPREQPVRSGPAIALPAD